MGSNSQHLHQESIHSVTSSVASQTIMASLTSPSFLEGKMTSKDKNNDENTGKLEDVEKLFHLLCLQIMSKLSSSTGPEDYKKLIHRLWHLPNHVIGYYSHPFSEENRGNTSKKNLQQLQVKLRGEVAKRIGTTSQSQLFKNHLEDDLKSFMNNLSFKSWSESELSSYISLISHAEVWEYLPEQYPNPMTEDIARMLIEHSNANLHHHTVKAIYYKGDIVGQVRLQFNRQDSSSAEISYWLGPQYWRKGIASKVVNYFTFKSFIEYPKVQRIFGVVRQENFASLKVLEKTGYRYESIAKRSEESASKNTCQVLGIMRGEFEDFLKKNQDMFTQ